MRVRVALLATLVIVALLAGTLFIAAHRVHDPSTLIHIAETTLVPLAGDVRVQHPGAEFAAINAETVVRIGDRVRTGADGYAVLAYFDGSSTELDPNSSIELERLDNLGAEGRNIAYYQDAGWSWNHVESRPGAGSVFETQTSSGTADAHGTDYAVLVDAAGQTTVQALTDRVVVGNSDVVESRPVVLPPGYSTVITPGHDPAPPVATAVPHLELRLDIVGPAHPFVMDAHNRSAGFYPQASVFSSQVPWTTFEAEATRQTVHLPAPAGPMSLVLSADGGGGAVAVIATVVIDGAQVATTRLEGSVSPGELVGTSIEVGSVNSAPGASVRAGALAAASVPPGARVAAAPVPYAEFAAGPSIAPTSAVLAPPPAAAVNSSATPLPTDTPQVVATSMPSNTRPPVATSAPAPTVTVPPTVEPPATATTAIPAPSPTAQIETQTVGASGAATQEIAAPAPTGITPTAIALTPGVALSPVRSVPTPMEPAQPGAESGAPAESVSAQPVLTPAPVATSAPTAVATIVLPPTEVRATVQVPAGRAPGFVPAPPGYPGGPPPGP